MIVNTISSCIATDKVEESKEFYIKHFDAKITFDCGWYVNLQFGNKSSELQFMAPQQLEQPKCNCAGLMYNLAVDDVDQEYKKLTDAGLEPVMPLEDHPWGDRGFAIKDPNGVMLYIYSEREPKQEFKQYYR